MPKRHCANNSITFACTLHHVQVDEEALAALDYCILSGDFDICEAVPAGENAGFPTGSLVNPLAGVSIDMAGPSRYKRNRASVATGSLRFESSLQKKKKTTNNR